MHKSVHYRDYTKAWPERRKNCAQDKIKPISTTPAQQNSDQLVASCRSIASMSTAATVSQPVSSTSINTKIKQHQGTKQRRLPIVYIKLAEENATNEHSESDSSCYDSINEMETDFCRDESDWSDGYVTDGFATMDVFEYEVDNSSDSEDLFSHGSSSGTDDMVEVVARALFASSSSSDSDDFEIFAQDADTEESDAPTDPELGRADYWECIKCKNKKNNPMYRFCEKCYQIRKNHFPPRPKHRRKRACPARRDDSKLSSPSSTSSHTSIQDKKHDEDGRMSRNSSDGSEEIGNDFMQNSKQMRKNRRRTTSHPQNHSAGESSCCSSQELSPDEQQSTLPSKYLMATCVSSQETYCSDIEHIVNVNKHSNLNLFEHNYPNSQESVYPNSKPISQASLLENVFDSAHELGKLDSLSSTVSGFSVGSSQSSLEYDANKNQHSIVPELKTCDSFNGSMNGKQSTTETVSNVAANKRKSKKRKIDFTDEISDSEIDDDELMAKKFRTIEETDSTNGMCMICLSEPKNGAFVHNRFLHVCCCYRCTVKVWNKRKRCPICNSQVKTVLKMFVH